MDGYRRRPLGAGIGTVELARNSRHQTFPKDALGKMKRRARTGRRSEPRERRSSYRSCVWIVVACLAVIASILPVTIVHAQEPLTEPSHAIVVRTTENISDGGWVQLLQNAKAAGVSRIDVLVKQDEDYFMSERTGRELQSGELLVRLPGETTAEGWENSDWLVQMLARAKELEIEIWAWWPVFHDAQVAALYPAAKYLGGDGSIFVDAAVDSVRERQEQLIEKLLRTYDFDGISLDWLRYDNWTDGTAGPLAEDYLTRAETPLSPQCMQDPLARAIWGDLRASSIAEWVTQLISSAKSSRPALKWGAYLLPPQFKEVSQNYRYLAQTGLAYIQPMIYWDLWEKSPEWSGEVLDRRTFWLKPGTEVLPTLDLTYPESDLVTSFEAMGEGGVSGFLWYLDSVWTKEHFRKIRRVQSRWREARAATTRSPWISPAKASATEGPVDRLPPAEFVPESSAWTLVLLSELYDQGALDGNDPVIPVLALHRFVENADGPGASIWANSSAYIERLMTFLVEHEFSVIPLSRLQAYMMSDSPDDLPARPLVLTIDDGAQSVLKYFHPQAQKHDLPYSLSVITSPLEASNADLRDDERSDRQLDWGEVEQLAESGLVELVSHTHRLHAYAAQGPGSESRAPSAIARAWLGGEGRRETSPERYHRVLSDLASSRQELQDRSAKPVNILAWPYGAFDETSERAARAAGFTHFLLFGGSRFAKPSWTTHRIARLPITREDEVIPLELPEDHLTAQRWWLAFLAYARRTASAQLIEATLVQLDNERARHPEAELSRAAVDALRGRPEMAIRRIQGLRALHSDELAVERAISGFLDSFQSVL